MSSETKAVVAWKCDECGAPYGEDGGDGINFLLEPDETPTDWQVIDGKDVCDRCVDRRECAEEGHDWSDWRQLANGSEYRFCRRCTAPMEVR